MKEKSYLDSKTSKQSMNLNSSSIYNENQTDTSCQLCHSNYGIICNWINFFFFFCCLFRKNKIFYFLFNIIDDKKYKSTGSNVPTDSDSSELISAQISITNLSVRIPYILNKCEHRICNVCLINSSSSKNIYGIICPICENSVKK
jgi:hypothetical protein